MKKQSVAHTVSRTVRYAARSMEVTPVKPDAQDGDEAEGLRLVADIVSA